MVWLSGKLDLRCQEYGEERVPWPTNWRLSASCLIGICPTDSLITRASGTEFVEPFRASHISGEAEDARDKGAGEDRRRPRVQRCRAKLLTGRSPNSNKTPSPLPWLHAGCAATSPQGQMPSFNNKLCLSRNRAVPNRRSSPRFQLPKQYLEVRTGRIHGILSCCL